MLPQPLLASVPEIMAKGNSKQVRVYLIDAAAAIQSLWKPSNNAVQKALCSCHASPTL